MCIHIQTLNKYSADLKQIGPYREKNWLWRLRTYLRAAARDATLRLTELFDALDRFFITARALHNPDADPPSTRSYYQAINRQKQGFGLIKHWLSVPCHCCIYWTNQPKTMFKRLRADKALVVYTRQLLH